jgi:hypothetical protein
MTIPSLREFCQQAIDSKIKADEFVRLREQLHNLYFKRVIFSTSHGVDIFQNIINELNKPNWVEDGEYGFNFKSAIKRFRTQEIRQAIFEEERSDATHQ